MSPLIAWFDGLTGNKVGGDVEALSPNGNMDPNGIGSADGLTVSLKAQILDRYLHYVTYDLRCKDIQTCFRQLA